MEKPPAFPQPANIVSHSSASMTVYAHSHSAYYGEYPSRPILIEREKENKKEAGASPSAQTEGGTPATLLNRCLLFYMDFLTTSVVLSFSR